MQIHKSSLIKLTIFLLTLRSPLIIPVIVIYTLAERGMFKKMVLRMIPFILFIVVMALYSLNLINGLKSGPDVFGQCRDILLAMVVFTFLVSASEIDDKNPAIVYNSLKFCLTMVGIAKALAIVFVGVTGMSAKVLITYMNSHFGLGMMTLGVDDSAFFRLQIPLDSLVPLFIYFIVKEAVNKSGSKLLIYFILLSLCFSMLVTMSRVVWAQTLVIIALALVKEAKVYTMFKVITIGTVLITILYMFTPVGDAITQIVNVRLGTKSSSLNADSDIQRALQNNGLYDAFIHYPLLGNGLGYYLPGIIRSQDAKYLYESQSLSILMNLGIIGTIIFLALVVYTCFMSALKDGGGLGMPSLFILFWIFSGTFNPFLFGVAGGGMLFMAAKFHTFYRPSYEEPVACATRAARMRSA